jgi:hypothetical protein
MKRLILVFGIFVSSSAPFLPKIHYVIARLKAGAPFSMSQGARFTDGISIKSKEQERAGNLEHILAKAAEYCQRLEQVSLHFVCTEEIEERLYYSGRFYKENNYTYDYQLIRKGEGIQERRTLLEENGKSRHEENAELKTHRFFHKHVIFGPIGLLSESQQQNHDYVIKKEEKIKGDRCLVIEAVPKEGVQVDHLFGKAWIRENDCSIMKIEWNQESMGNIERLEEAAKKAGAKPIITFVSEYAYEKNGIRFPSKYFVKEEYVKRGRYKISQTTTVYKDYKFFIVETEVKIK